MGFGHASAGAFDDCSETASQLADAVRLMEEHGLAWDQFLSNAESRCAGEQILCGILLGDAATGNERNVREGAAHGAEIVVAANK